ncbi:tyrosine-protein phosphatase [Luedemannella flava]
MFRSAAPEYLSDDGWAAAKAAEYARWWTCATPQQRRGARQSTRSSGPHRWTGWSSWRRRPRTLTTSSSCGWWPLAGPPRCWVDNARLARTRIARVMRAVAEAETAVLVHCAGGRDRTGMICAMLLDLAGATGDAIIDDYADGWRGAGAYSGHGWIYDPDQQTWRQRHLPATEPQQLESQLADRVPALRDWITTFDTATYLATLGLTRHEIDSLKALLRP